MVSVENLSYKVKESTLLKDVHFVANQGELVVLLGANGAGKSTLIKLLSGEPLPTGGSITFKGRSINDYNALELACFRATLSQQVFVSMDFKVEEVVMMGRYPYYQHKASLQDMKAVSEAMSVCQLEHLRHRSILTLSGGEQQRVHLARVLAQVWSTPNALLLMDEPVSAMDIQFQHHTLAILRALTQKGFTVIMALHDMTLAAQYADRLLLLKNGRKFYDGAPAEVLTPRNIYTIFSIDAQVKVDATNLELQVNTHPMQLDAESFNSMLPTKDTEPVKYNHVENIEEEPVKSL